MATRQVVIHVASCDVCGMEADPGSGQGATPREAIDDLTVHDGTWKETVDGHLVCDRSDPAHNAARDGESPRLLAMGADAMAVTWPAAAPAVTPSPPVPLKGTPVLDPTALTTKEAVQTAWRQFGRDPKTLTSWSSSRLDDGTLLLTAQVTGTADMLRSFAARHSPHLADYIRPGSGDTLPSLDYPQPGRTALSWRVGGVWVELWHEEPARPVERPTPATVAVHAARRTPVPSARLPFGRLRNALTHKENRA